MQQVSRILIRVPNWIGDVVMSLDAVAALRKAYPDAQIDVLSRKKLEPMLKCLDGVNTVYVEDEGVWNFIKLSLRLRKNAYDVGVVFPNSFRTALSVFCAGAKRRIGFAGQLRTFLLSDRIKKVKGASRHQRYDYLELVQVLGVETDSSSLPLLSPEDISWAKDQFKQSFEHFDGIPVVGINPTASYGPAKCWFRENYEELIRRVLSHRKVNFIVFADHEHKETSEWIAAECEKQGCGVHVVDFGGKTSLSELISLLAACDAVVSNDSGPMHLSAGLGVAQVSIFGSTDPRLTGPCGANNVVLWERIECSPCFERVCPLSDGRMECMKRISVDQVLDALFDLLDARHSTSGHNA